MAIAAVLNSSLGKLSCDQAVVKLATSGANVHAWVSVRQRPCHSIGVADRVGRIDERARLAALDDRA